MSISLLLEMAASTNPDRPAVVSGETGETGETGELRTRLRGSRTPDRVVFRDELPTNATGKIRRRDLVDELNAASKESA